MNQLILCLAVILSSQSFANCSTDASLKARGFKVHTRNFQKYQNLVESWFLQNEERFVDDLSGTIYSSVASQMIVIKSFDLLDTPQPVMFGDVVFMRSFLGDKAIEVRWFENGQKNVAYDRTFQECATNTIPIAINSLF